MFSQKLLGYLGCIIIGLGSEADVVALPTHEIRLAPHHNGDPLVLAQTMQPAIDCIQTELSKLGESLLRVDRQQGILITHLHSASPQVLSEIANVSSSSLVPPQQEGRYQFIVMLTPTTQTQTLVNIKSRILGWNASVQPALMRPSPFRTLGSSQKLESNLSATLKQQCDGPI